LAWPACTLNPVLYHPDTRTLRTQADSDCGGCCSQNTGSGKWTLIDLEKWPASRLLGFDPNAPGFDINNVNTPSAGSSRPGAPSSVMPLCFRDVGAETTPSITTCGGASGEGGRGAG
jgi:hypothetical protein